MKIEKIKKHFSKDHFPLGNEDVSSSSTFMEPVCLALLDKFFMTELFLIGY